MKNFNIGETIISHFQGLMLPRLRQTPKTLMYYIKFKVFFFFCTWVLPHFIKFKVFKDYVSQTYSYNNYVEKQRLIWISSANFHLILFSSDLPSD